MLLHASESTQEGDQELSKSIRGVMFLGTPHQGSPLADIGETMTRIVSVAGFDTAQNNTKTLKIDSDLLKECQRRFLLFLKRRNEIDICIFQEGHGMKGFSYLRFNEKVIASESTTYLPKANAGTV